MVQDGRRGRGWMGDRSELDLGLGLEAFALFLVLLALLDLGEVSCVSILRWNNMELGTTG
jgi:hypothetical protein